MRTSDTSYEVIIDEIKVELCGIDNNFHNSFDNKGELKSCHNPMFGWIKEGALRFPVLVIYDEVGRKETFIDARTMGK